MVILILNNKILIKSLNYILIIKLGYIFQNYIYIIYEVELKIKIFIIYINKSCGITLISNNLFTKVFLNIYIYIYKLISFIGVSKFNKATWHSIK